MSIATILLIPTSEFIALYGAWLIGALGIAGFMVMLTLRLRVLGSGED